MKQNSLNNSERYKQKNSKIKFNLLTRLLFLIFIILMFIFTFYNFINSEKTGIQVSNTKFEVINSSKTNFSFTLNNQNNDTRVKCILRVRDYENNEVGKRELLIPAEFQKGATINTAISTYSKGFIADVYKCDSYIPDYLKIDKKTFP